MGLFGIVPTPEGEDPSEAYQKMMEQHQQQHDEAVMQSQDESHQVWDFIGRLSVDDLNTLKVMLRRIEDRPDQLFMLNGMIAGRLKYEFNLCPGCGKDHFNELLPPGESDGSG